MGEVNFYKALCIENLIDSFTSFWSVGMPMADGSGIRDTAFESDVDCVIVQGSSMYLIDLKSMSPGISRGIALMERCFTLAIIRRVKI
ncbi:hypothetical protein HMPREF1628_04545 [Actinomyces sp. S4-C9]|nr:hypothetical protein HMPREF1628_04545 [Actinomyces sp. S4-C9]